MRLSTKSRFAVTAMIDVALREDRGPVSLAAISERHQISLSYLEQLFSKLRQAGLVESTRGPGGGYSLGRAAEQISMADILAAVDAPTADEAAGEQESWMSSDLWSSVNNQMLAQLAEELLEVGQRDLVTLADGGQRHRALLFTQGHVDHGGHGKTAFGTQTHGGLLLRRSWT